MIFLFHKNNISICSFCNLKDETVNNLFVLCSKTKRLWCTVIDYFKRNLDIPFIITTESFLEADDKVFLILNYLLLLFRY